MEQRIAELRADLRTEFERRVAELARRIDALDTGLAQRTVEARAKLREGLALLEGRMLARMALSEPA